MEYEQGSDIDRLKIRPRFYVFRDPFKERDADEDEKFSIRVRIAIIVGLTALSWFGIYLIATWIF